MYSKHSLHSIGSNNTEYKYPIFDGPDDIPAYPPYLPMKYQIDANTTGYIRAMPNTIYPYAGLHQKRSDGIVLTAYPITVDNLNLQWHWRYSSGPYNSYTYICPDSATLDFAIHTDLEIVALWYTTGYGWQSSVCGTIPAGATSVQMSSEYGGETTASVAQRVTAWYFIARTKVAYRQISGYCVYTMASATITANVHLSEPLPVGHIYLYADWYGTLPPWSMHFGGFDVMGAGVQDGSSFYSFDPYLGLGPVSYYTFLRYFPETSGAYGQVDFVGRSYAPAGGGQWTDNFTLDIPTGSSADVDSTPEYSAGAATSANLGITETYW